MKIHCSHDRLVPLSKLKPHPRNPNTHPNAQIELLAVILKAQGWRNPIVVSKRSGFIVNGHGRLLAAQKLKLKEAPVNFQRFDSEEQELAHLIADNQIQELAETDDKVLKDLIAELGKTDLDLSLLGLGDEELQRVLGEINPQEPDDEHAAELVDKAAELQKKWKTKRGQVWELGEHRLMCGDSTSKEDVSVLLDGDKPALMVTDPPYGVEYDPGWREGHDLNMGKGLGLKGMARSLGKVQNDDRVDWTDAYQLSPCTVAYVWHAGVFAAHLATNLSSSDFTIRAQIIWVKQHFVFGRGAYHWQHEPCWYAVRKGAKSNWLGDRTQTTVWQIENNNPIGHHSDKEQKTSHGTQKPLECMARPIRNHAGDVYDPFLGSGTTLIACEQLNRRCRAMEISPAYVAVALQRWSDLTHKTPKLLK